MATTQSNIRKVLNLVYDSVIICAFSVVRSTAQNIFPTSANTTHVYRLAKKKRERKKNRLAFHRVYCSASEVLQKLCVF